MKKDDCVIILDEFVKEFESLRETYVVPKYGKRLKDFNSKIKRNLGRSRYNKYLCWCHIDLEKEIELKDRFKDITAIHIKPYQITESDVIQAKQKSKQNNFKREMENNNIGFVDYDKDTGNYHKIADGKLQAVLVKDIWINGKRRYGPEFTDAKNFNEKYHIPYNSDNDENISLEDLLNLVFKTILA